MKKQAELTTQDGLIELAGATPLWIWAHPCRIVDCDCRLALILASTDGRAALLERGAEIHKAWHTGSDLTRVGSLSADLDVFLLHIDSVDANGNTLRSLELALPTRRSATYADADMPFF